MKIVNIVKYLLFLILCNLFIIIPSYCEDINNESTNLTQPTQQVVYRITIPFFTNIVNPDDKNFSDLFLKQFVYEFKQSRTFILIEQNIVNKAISKFKILSSNIINTSQIIELGKETGADFIITGSIIPLENNNIWLNIRFVDSQTGKIVGTKKFILKEPEIENKVKEFTELISSMIKKKEIAPSILQMGTTEGTEIRISTIPEGASVVFDEQFIGKSPIILKDVKKGKHTLTMWISEPITSVEAIVDSTPSGVTVQKDDEQLGITPVTIKKISMGSVYLNFSAKGKAKCKIMVNSLPKDVPVALDGQYISKTPMLITDVPLGTHELTVLEKKLVNINKVIDVPATGILNINIPIFQIGKMILNTSTPEVEVYIDDFPTGVTPVTLVIPKGKHTLLLKKERYATHEEEINIESCSTIEKTVDMKLQRARDSSISFFPTAELAYNLSFTASYLTLGQLQSTDITQLPLFTVNTSTSIYGGELIYSLPFSLELNNIFDFRIGLGGFYHFIKTGDVMLPSIYGIGTKLKILKETSTIPLSLAIGGFWYKDTLDRNNWNIFASVSRNVGDFSIHLGASTKNLSLKLNYTKFYNFIISAGAFIDMGLLIPNSSIRFTPLIGVSDGYTF